jgi:uncharacterized SAM-binding protein YcdF (DUF218 family)
MDNLPEGEFGTLSEAKALSRTLPENIRKLVIVISAAHTRRSLLTFRKHLPKTVTVVPYAATPFDESLEMYCPLWLEYLKLLVYALIA